VYLVDRLPGARLKDISAFVGDGNRLYRQRGATNAGDPTNITAVPLPDANAVSTMDFLHLVRTPVSGIVGATE